MHRILEALMIVFPMMKEITQTDCHVALCDTEKCIGRWDATTFSLPGGCKPGDSILEDRFINEVKRTRKTAVDKLPAEVFGTPILNVNMPIYDGDEYVGCIIFCSSREQQTKIQANSKELNDDIEFTRQRAESTANRVEEFSASLSAISDASRDLAEQTNKVSGLIKTIQSTASQSNILALNATIEAARAGEHGRGFSVVADKMGQLAKISASSAKDISSSLSDIFERLESLNKEIADSAEGAGDQSRDIHEISDTLERISSSSSALMDFADNC